MLPLYSCNNIIAAAAILAANVVAAARPPLQPPTTASCSTRNSYSSRRGITIPLRLQTDITLRVYIHFTQKLYQKKSYKTKFETILQSLENIINKQNYI